jgi:chaperone required for assembly of F1-ATPase
MLRTPARAQLLLASRALAEAVAEEWRAQGERLSPASLPLTQLVNTAVDRVSPNPGPVIDELLGYAGTDLVCYRAERPDGLVRRQERQWQPLLDDLARRHDVLLHVHRGIVPRPQPAEALACLGRLLAQFDALRLTAMAAATAVCGSLVIALALIEGRITPEAAFELSQLDETYQIEQWGEDSQAAVRRSSLRRELADIHRLLILARMPD